jgi:hypothetical protein
VISDRELELVLVELLAPADDRLPKAVRDAALASAWRERRRVPRPWDGWTSGFPTSRPWSVTTRTRVIAVVLLVGLLAAGLIAGGALRERERAPDPVPLDPGALRGLWLGLPAQPGSGAWRMRFSDFAILEGPGPEFQVLAGYRVHDDRIEVPAGIGDCLGVAATYRGAIVADRLVLERIDDACSSRAKALEGQRWVRVPSGAGVAHRFRVPFTYPDLGSQAALEETTTTLQGFGGATVDRPNGLVAWIIEDTFDQACRGGGEFATPRSLEPGAEALAARLEAMPELDVERRATTTAAGRPALHLHLRVDPDRCAASTARLWEDLGAGVTTGTTSLGQFFELAPGGEADVFIVDVEGTTVSLVAWDAAGRPISADRQQLIDGIRFITP